MKVKKDFLLRQVAGSWVAVAVGAQSVDFDGMLTLNESGALLWRALEQGADRRALTQALTDLTSSSTNLQSISKTSKVNDLQIQTN